MFDPTLELAYAMAALRHEEAHRAMAQTTVRRALRRARPAARRTPTLPRGLRPRPQPRWTAA